MVYLNVKAHDRETVFCAPGHLSIEYRAEVGLPISAKPVEKGLLGLLIGLFSEAVISIDFEYFCKGIYDSCEGIANQDDFVIDVFKAAGSSYSFNKKSFYSSPNYAAKLYNGGKQLSRNHRGSFPNPIDTQGLSQYLAMHIKKNPSGT